MVEMERNLKSLEKWDLLVYDEDDYTEEEFSKFLKSTKENLAKMTISNRDDSCDDDSSKNDRDFSNFLGQLKKGFSANQSISNAYTAQNKNQRSHSVTTPKSADSLKSEATSEKRSLSTSFLSLSEMEEDSLMNFPKKRLACSKKLYKLFNEKIFDSKLPQDMELIWSNSLKTTAGKTYASKKNNKYLSCTISLSSAVLTTFERLRDTLLHEMCHAAVFLISQIRESSHGPLWQTWAVRCHLIFPDIDVPERCHTYEISYPLYYKCDKCSWKIGRCRISEKLSKCLCPNCRRCGFVSKLSLVKS